MIFEQAREEVREPTRLYWSYLRYPGKAGPSIRPGRRLAGRETMWLLTRVFLVGCFVGVVIVIFGCSKQSPDSVAPNNNQQSPIPIANPDLTGGYAGSPAGDPARTSSGQNPIPTIDTAIPPDVHIDAGNNAPYLDNLDQLDIVIMVDNSISMEEEQRILATQFFNLVNALVDPPVEPECGVFENVRIGIITSNMGLQAGDDKQLPTVVFDQCEDFGDNAIFKTYGAGHSIDIQPNAIRCNPTASQCPIGWSCANISDNDVGTCYPPGGDGSNQPCPALSGLWLETKSSEKNPNLAFQTSCLAKQGTRGCGIEQQIKAIQVAPIINAGFLRDDALLALIIVSDEEDCSISDVALFNEPEFDTNEVNLVCGRHPNHIHPAAYFRDRLLELKGGDTEKVIFAGIVGVPLGPECEGTGDTLSNCLSHPKMQLSEVEDVSTADSSAFWIYAPACERYSTDGSTAIEDRVTKALPGRRYVELAQQFGSKGYISSICNEDWEGIMREIAKLLTCTIIE